MTIVIKTRKAHLVSSVQLFVKKNFRKKKIAVHTQPSADSQLTSSDKLSALPSRLHHSPSPAGRRNNNNNNNKSNSGSPEGASFEGLPSNSTITQEAHIAAQTLPRRAPLPVAHSLSESAAEFSTLPRQRISFDSERGSSTSPRPGELLNRRKRIYLPPPSAFTCSC
jgi:hypothetical protein